MTISIDEILDRIEAGASTKAIASEIGVNEEVINNWVVENLGLSLMLNVSENRTSRLHNNQVYPFPIFGVAMLQ